MKKLLTILVLIMLIISFFQITSMYALYKDQLQGEYSTLLGAWKIKVNDTDITTSGETKTFTIDQLQYVESDYIEAGKIAPGSQAYFDIEIDPTNNDVSIVYTLELGSPANATLELVSASNYFLKILEDETQSKIENDLDSTIENTYTSIIPLNMITQGYKNYLRVYFKWKNKEGNNEGDSTLAGTDGAKLSVPVEINFKQYIGEGIGNEAS